MSSVFEKSSNVPQVNSLSYQQRKEFLRKNGKELPFSEEYKGTEKQNTALVKFLKNNPNFKQKWEQELQLLKTSSNKSKNAVTSTAKTEINEMIDKNKPTFPIQTPEQFLSNHGIDLSAAPAGIRNNNPFNIKWSNSDFQKRILVDGIEPSKNKDQWNRQVVFKSPEAWMASGIRLLLHRYHNNKLHTVSALIADKSIWWTQDGTKGNKLGTNAAREIAERMNVGVNDYLDFNKRETFAKFIKSLLYQEHGDASWVYANVIPSVLDKLV